MLNKIVDINLKCECCFWIFDSKYNLSIILIFTFSDTSEISINGVRVRYADFLTLMSKFKGTVDMSENSLGKYKRQSCVWIFNSKFELNTPLVFGCPDTFRDEY